MGKPPSFKIFCWPVKCPKSSTKQILNANGIILTLRAWQRSNGIVYQHKDRSFKSNQVKLLEMVWNARILHRNDTLSPCLDVAAACKRVSNHIWFFYNVAWSVDVPTLRQCQKVSNDHSDMFHEIPQCRLLTSTATFLWFAAKRSRKSLNDSGACRRSWWLDILN